MSVVLHISDPHFGTELGPVVEALIALSRQIDPALVVLSGDLTQRARRSQFRAAAAFIERLAPRALVTLPGNHDIPLYNVIARSFWPYAGYRRICRGEFEPVHDKDDLLVIAVNTTRWYRHKDGEVSAAQVKQVCQRLAAGRDDQLKIVVTHQPVMAVEEQDVHNILHNAGPAVRAWSQAGAHLILGGHIHLPYLRPLSEGYGEAAGRTWIVQAGTALSSRVRFEAPNSVNVLHHHAAQHRCVVERYDFVAVRRRFEVVNRTEIPLGVPIIEPATRATQGWGREA